MIQTQSASSVWSQQYSLRARQNFLCAIKDVQTMYSIEGLRDNVVLHVVAVDTHGDSVDKDGHKGKWALYRK